MRRLAEEFVRSMRDLDWKLDFSERSVSGMLEQSDAQRHGEGRSGSSPEMRVQSGQ
jgi:hypothetical protein